MREAHNLVLAQSGTLWIAAGLLLDFTIFAAYSSNMRLIEAALLANGAFACLGIGFGIWTECTLGRR